MAKGLVYILTNPCLDGWVKIGETERNDIEKRLQELNAPPNIPLSYRCYATYEVENPKQVEEHIHSLIDRIDDSLHAREMLDNGRIREREFFKISAEAAYGIFKDIAALRGDSECLRLHAPTPTQAQEQAIAEKGTKRSNNSFKLLGIAIGEEIVFLYDSNVKATVVNEKNQVCYNGVQYSVSKLAHKLLVDRNGWNESTQVNGWCYFTKSGIALNDLRNKIETEDDDIDE